MSINNNIHFFDKLSTRLFTPLVVIFIFVIIILITYVPSVTQEHTINSAISTAENTVRQEDGLVEHLRKVLQSPNILMRVEVDKSNAPEPPPKPKRLMSSKEKYLAMRETNPLLQEMQKRFDLRPDE